MRIRVDPQPNGRCLYRGGPRQMCHMKTVQRDALKARDHRNPTVLFVER